MAILYNNTGRIDEAEKCIGEAVALSQECDDPATVLYITNTAGSIYSVMKQYDKAAAILKASLRKAQEADMPRFVMQCMTPLLVLFANTGDLSSFERYNAEAQPWIKRLPPSSNELTGYHEALAAGYARQRRYARSNDHYRRLIELHPHNAHAPLHRLHLLMARNCFQMGQSRQAAEHYERALEIVDSLRAADIDCQISDLNVRYRTLTKELKLARLQRDDLQHKNSLLPWSIAGLAVLAVSLTLLFYEIFRRRQQQQQAALDVARSFIEGLEKERERLSKELHDGVANDLLGLGMMLRLLDKRHDIRQEITDSIESIRNDVRNISHELSRPRFQHTTLNEAAESLLHRMDSTNDIDIRFRAAGLADHWAQLPDEVALETYRILQELMSNIVRHSSATFATVEMEVTARSLQLDIVNDGREYDPATSCGGIGLYTIDERVKALGARFERNITPERQEYHLLAEWKIPV